MSPNDKKLFQTANEIAKGHYKEFEIARDKRKGDRNNRVLLGNAGKQIVAKGNKQNVVNIRVRTSAANHKPRQWDAGRNWMDSHKSLIYIFLNIWDNYPVKEIECFVVPSKFVEEQVALERSKRPQFKLPREEDKEFEFLDNWKLIKELLNS